MTKKTPTIQDVARHAKVSAATVSRALSSPERVSEATRERIVEAVRQTGYTINQAARSLRLKAARTILIALPNVGNPFYSTILDAVVAEAAPRGYGVLVANRLGDNPTAWLRDYFFSNRADGLLLFDASLDAEELTGLPPVHGTLPLVVVCDELLDPRFHTVTTDNFEASRRATEYLIKIGHTRLGIVRGPVFKTLRNERLAGFEAALHEAGLPVDPEWILPGDHSMASGYRAGQGLLKLAERPTAMFCANDEMAIGLIAALREGGVECPRDISVIGFDDIPVARHYSPPLTTVHQPRSELGRIATEALLDILESDTGHRRPLRVVLKSELVVRESTKPYIAPGAFSGAG